MSIAILERVPLGKAPANPPSALDRLRDYAAKVDPTTPWHRGRVIRGVRLQSFTRSGSFAGSFTPSAVAAAFFPPDPPDPLDLLGPDLSPLSYSDLAQGF